VEQLKSFRYLIPNDTANAIFLDLSPTGFFGTIINMAKDWTKIYKRYKGLWVTLAGDEMTVLSSHKTARTALEKARKNGHKSPILMRVPEDLKTFVGAL
jgi:hypothetical protein